MALHPWDQNRVWRLIARKLAGEATQDNLAELAELKYRYPEIEDYIIIISDWWHLTETMGKEDADLFVKELIAQLEQEGKLPLHERRKKGRFFKCLV